MEFPQQISSFWAPYKMAQILNRIFVRNLSIEKMGLANYFVPLLSLAIYYHLSKEL